MRGSKVRVQLSDFGEVGRGHRTEVSTRQWQGGTSGVSFRIAKGVRYHVGRIK